uniref:11-beta-hydroxysteroid dehydrogenase 1 n=1 Tax=Terrapene triunguis TaxID=2587831 RepID=A0A674JW93_9SAUR
MGLLRKIFIPFVGLVLAFCFYSAREDFKPEMLKGKRVIVTGASTGIGEQMAYHLARMGAHVLITARTEAKLQKVITRCLELGAASAQYVSGSMEDEAFAEHVVKEAELVLGTLAARHLEIAIRPLTSDKMQRDVASLLKSNKAFCSTATELNCVNIVPLCLGKVGFPFTAPYSATKFALDGFFSSLRQELIIQKVDVSITLCILGFVDTESAMKAASDVVLMSPAPKEECALEIIKGGALRQREIYYKYAATKIPLLIRDWAPELLDYLIRRSYNVENLKKN